MKFKSIKSKSIFVIGLGISGLSLARKLKNNCNKLVCWDDSLDVRKRALKFNLNLKLPTNVELNRFDYIVLSPGISESYLDNYKNKKKIKLISDIEFFRFIDGKKLLVGITGTNGKSTTTKMLEHTLEHSNVKIAGNIGLSFSELKLNSTKQKNLIIIEASSYQLERIDKIRFNIACLLNISPDHLERHQTMQNYLNAKLKIFKNQKRNDHAIVCIDDDYCKKVRETFKKKFLSNPIFFSVKQKIKNGVFLEEKKDVLEITNNIHNEFFTIFKKNLNIFGKHNYQNLLATYIINKVLGTSTKKFIKRSQSFSGLEHRLEKIGSFKGLNFFNDSKSTNLESSIGALKSLKNIFWIAGGLSKSNGLKGVENHLLNVKRVFLYGQDRYKILKSFKKKVIINEFLNLDVAFEKAFELASKKTGEINILFSPACASFDQFKNFEERGKKFKLLVKQKIYSCKNNDS